MPAIKVTVLVERDGVMVPGFPYTRRLNPDEVQLFDPYLKTNDGDTVTYTSLPLLMPTLKALLVRADQTVSLRLNAQTDAGITVTSGGLVLLFDVSLTAGAATNARVNNNSGAVANIRGFGAGT